MAWAPPRPSRPGTSVPPSMDPARLRRDQVTRDRHDLQETALRLRGEKGLSYGRFRPELRSRRADAHRRPPRRAGIGRHLHHVRPLNACGGGLLLHGDECVACPHQTMLPPEAPPPIAPWTLRASAGDG